MAIMGNSFILHLIRHAPTAGNQAKQYIGWTDEAVLPFKAEPDASQIAVWGSDLKRCRQTAACLFPNAVYHASPDWRECHFGEWEQKTYAELESNGLYRNWVDDPFHFAPPNGESLHQLATRIERAVKALPDGDEFTILTHGGPIRYLLARATGESIQQQTASHGHRITLVWKTRKAVEEGDLCTSFSAVPLMANVNT
ncbi:histidine phosphatase family protein [Planococcus massiliensis]|nr:histidine phosphatase family protein [Planococcus massiliensis]